MHVAAQPQQVGVPLDQHGPVAALQQVAVPLVAVVEIDRVGRLQPVHEAAEIAPRRLQHQVQVVGHQAEQIQPDLERRHALAQHPQETLPVGVILEDRPPLIAPGRHVVHGPFILDALRSGHVPILPARTAPQALNC